MLDRYLSPMAPEPTHLPQQGRLQPTIQCLLCDIYGTLLISGSGDINITRQQKPHLSILGDLLDRYEVMRSPQGLFDDLLAAIKNEHQQARQRGIDYPEIQIDKVWATILPLNDPKTIRAFAMEWEMVLNPVWPMPGVSELFNICRRKGVILGAISNAQFFTPLLFKWLLGEDLRALGFDRRLIFFSYAHGRAKPSPALFESAIDQLAEMGISTDRTAFIGNDMRNDIAPARRIGLQTILFAGDARSLRLRGDDPLCNHIEPDLRINHLNQLAPYLG